MKHWLAVALLAPAVCGAAQPASWFLGGGLGVAERGFSQAPFDQLELEYEDGIAYHVRGGARFDSGLLLRGDYAHTRYEALTALGTLTVDEGIVQRELRLGGFYAPRPEATATYRVGGGYALFGDPAAGSADGFFAEVAATVRTGPRLSWDLSIARQEVSGDSGNDFDATDLRLAATWRLGTLDLSLAARQLRLPSSDDLRDFRVAVGRSWGAAD